MIVDSSALAEQVVADVIASAFDSAGQRCSALRILCLQEDAADRILTMLKGRLHELSIGRTDRLSVDIGPVITAEAKANIEAHIARMRALGHSVEQIGLAADAGRGTFVPPTIIEMDSLSDLDREVFGPVLHVIRYRRPQIDRLIDDINATGYGLTFGLHTRLDETIAHVSGRIRAGNLYVNRNIIGAVVGVQPFGGRGMSGTGPKAGGPLYLGRLVENAPVPPEHSSVSTDPALSDFALWLDAQSESQQAEKARHYGSLSALGLQITLPGPVGESNLYALHPRGRILLIPHTREGLREQVAAILATGNDAVIHGDIGLANDIPANVAGRISRSTDIAASGPYAGALVEGAADKVIAAQQMIAALPGPIPLVQASDDAGGYCLDWLLEEVSTSINTTAAGGNASLMTIA